MQSFLAQLLFTALSLAVVATAALFVGRARRPRARGLVRTLVAAALVAAVALVSGAVVGAGPTRSGLVAGVLAVVVLGCVEASAPWTIRGLLAWSMTITAGAAYLGYVAVWTLTADLSVLAAAAGWCLWLLECFVYLLALGYLWELVDVLARWDWRRRVELRRELSTPTRPTPFVSLHVPTHNEPPDLVIETLTRLVALEYDDFEVLVLDNNTDDPALWGPVAAFCDQHERLRFFHLEDWPGYKSGALNYGLRQTDPRAEVIGVVDADYFADPDFLTRCAPLFRDPGLGFVQTPQDYRDWETDAYFRRLYHSYGYFFDVSQRSRNERGGAIFGGTMGLIRRSALTGLGGWDEWCITEDAELSLRLLKAGWSGRHVEQSFGRGVMPLTFEALKRQRFRWCFGGVQILRLHWRALLPGRVSETNRLTLSQRWAYLVGGLQWFGDLAGLLFTGFLLAGVVGLALGHGVVLRAFSGPLLLGVVTLVLLSSLRSVALVRQVRQTTWQDSLGALGLWLGLGWVVALGSVRGLVAREGAFLRTPKTHTDVDWRDALRGNVVEVLLGALCLTGIGLAMTTYARSGGWGGPVLAVLLALQGAGFLAAPLNSLAAVRADLTPELRRRRRDKLLSWTRAAPGVRRWGLGPALVTGLAVATILLLAAPVGGPPVSDISRDAGRSPHRDAALRPSDRPAHSTRTTPSEAPRPGSPDSTGVAPVIPTGTPSGSGQPTAQPTPVVQPSATVPTQPGSAPTTPTGRPTGSPTQRATPTQGVRPTAPPSHTRP